MRTQLLVFILLLTLGISKNFVSGKPISDIGTLSFSQVIHINKRARCTREDTNNDKCGSSEHAIDENPGGEESGGNEEKNGGEGRNKKENRGGGADRQAADDDSGADRASYQKNRRRELKKNVQ